MQAHQRQGMPLSVTVTVMVSAMASVSHPCRLVLSLLQMYSMLCTLYNMLCRLYSMLLITSKLAFGFGSIASHVIHLYRTVC